jgi:hypothetical protein
MSKRIVALFVGAAVSATGLSGCGGAKGSQPTRSPSLSDALIPVSRVEAVFHPAPAHLDGLYILRNLQSPLPYGDLGEYGVYKAKGFSDAGRPGTDVGTITVFSTVRAARRASIRILNGGECGAHPRPGWFSIWRTCGHLRVGNVLVITAPDISPAHRRTLTNALKKLGVPTAH